MAKKLKSRQSAPRSGEYEIVGPRGGDSGKERTTGYVIRRPAHSNGGVKEVAGAIRTKSGRIIIASPVKSANTLSSWSKAFKK
jgi:hypothetical protein